VALLHGVGPCRVLDEELRGGRVSKLFPCMAIKRPTDVPGQATESADYVLIAEIVNIEHWQRQAERRVQALADDLEHLVSSRRMLVLERVL
jgi:hypothetical protein